MTPALIICAVISVYDGDGPYRCASGERLRIAGVQSADFVRASPCRDGRAGYVCDDRLAAQQRDIAAGLVVGRTLTCRPLGRSGNRIVASCTLPGGEDLRCALIRAGAAADWARYRDRYGLGRCNA